MCVIPCCPSMPIPQVLTLSVAHTSASGTLIAMNDARGAPLTL